MIGPLSDGGNGPGPYYQLFSYIDWIIILKSPIGDLSKVYYTVLVPRSVIACTIGVDLNERPYA